LIADPYCWITLTKKKSRFIISCAAKLSKERGVEWLFLLDKSYRSGLPATISPAQLLTPKAFPLPTGWRFWYDWQLSRVIKKHKPDMVMTSIAGVYQKRLPRSLKKSAGLDLFFREREGFA